MWILTFLLLGGGIFLLVRTLMELTASSRYSFRNKHMQRKRMNALMLGILGLLMLSICLYIFVGK